MSESNGEAPATVTVPASEYQTLKANAAHYYGQAEAAGREVAQLRAERDAESIAKAIKVAAEAAGVRPEALGDVVAMVGPGLRVDGGEVRVKGSPEAGVAGYVSAFLEQRPTGCSARVPDQRRRPRPPQRPRGS